METKTRSRCKTERPLDYFPKSNGKQKRHDGRHPSCKVCRTEYYQRNREKVIAQMREYRTRPGVAEKIERWHKEYAGRRFFYKTQANLKVRAKCKDEVATIAEVSRLWKTQRGVCPVTGRRLDKQSAQLDHIVPLKLGGSDLVDNLRWVHRDVNYAKRDLLDKEFYRLCWDVVSHLGKPRKTARLNGVDSGRINGHQYVIDDQWNLAARLSNQPVKNAEESVNTYRPASPWQRRGEPRKRKP